MLEGDKQYLYEQLRLVVTICVHGRLGVWRSAYETCILENERIPISLQQKEELYQLLERIVCDASIVPNELYDKLIKSTEEYIRDL